MLPVLAVSFGIEAGCQPSGASDAAWPGTLLLVAAVGWSQKIHGKLGELVVLLRVSVVEHDFPLRWRVFCFVVLFCVFLFLCRVGLNIWYSHIGKKRILPPCSDFFSFQKRHFN